MSSRMHCITSDTCHVAREKSLKIRNIVGIVNQVNLLSISSLKQSDSNINSNKI